MQIDKMPRMNSEQLANHMLTLTAEDLKYLMYSWDLQGLNTAATCEAARRYLAANTRRKNA